MTVLFKLTLRGVFGEGNGTPLQYSCLENPMEGGTWQAAVRGASKSRTQLSDCTFTFHSHALEKEMETHSSVLAWRIPETVEPGWAAIYWVAQSRTRLKRLSSSSSRGVIFYYSQGINFDIVNPLQYSDILCLLISSLILFPFCLLFSIYFVSLFYVLICFLQAIIRSQFNTVSSRYAFP